ncbi:hypothetical protein EW145_g339 [Phellinidium pouzarii]|uniref:Uncharacterized protein n=1 Tax=Phellinidium pouzarii TaxID=167371 RepID=A0A4S4LIS1_9AGAM|nr:hypothetical protein EW145_g339 [Phellinidium pouzarii]
MVTTKPDSPPPAYSTIPSIPSPVQQSESSPHSLSGSASIPYVTGPFHHQQGTTYGPTPILQQQGCLLPYYDPRSPYSMEQAASRARWRFIGALAWAVGIWIAFGIVTGGIVIDIRRS